VLADGVCDATVPTLFERMYGEGRMRRGCKRQRRKIETGMAALAQALCPCATYLLGDAFGLADIATGIVLGYLELQLPEFDWKATHPHVADRFARISERPSFGTTRPAGAARFRSGGVAVPARRFPARHAPAANGQASHVRSRPCRWPRHVSNTCSPGLLYRAESPEKLAGTAGRAR
jgi:hypothetical protein